MSLADPGVRPLVHAAYAGVKLSRDDLVAQGYGGITEIAIVPGLLLSDADPNKLRRVWSPLLGLTI